MVQLLPPWPNFPKDVRTALLALRKAVLGCKSSRRSHIVIMLRRSVKWDTVQKGKFPEGLKPATMAAGRAAYQNGMFNFGEDSDQSFFQALPSVLPYNCFTLQVGIGHCLAP
jgi:hypothetical protein